MFRRNRNVRAEHGEALVVGALPMIGWMAYPVQMYSTHPELSTFLMREGASRAGRWLPIYGGKDSRTEIAAIRLMDPIIEVVDVGVRTLSSIRRAVWRSSKPDVISLPVVPHTERWAPLVDQHLLLLAKAEAEHEAAMRRPDEVEVPPPAPVKRAA
jgi:hypothetical protein